MFPSLTAVYAALLALVLVALSGWVIAGRLGKNVLHGDGGDEDLNRRVRAQANFTEYVPLALLVIALYEASGGSRGVVHALAGLLLLARVAQPFGMTSPAGSARQYVCRGGAAISTLLVLGVGALLLLGRMA